MRKELEHSLVKTLTSDDMHRISTFGCESPDERRDFESRYDWDEKKRIYILKENGKD